MLDSPIGWLVLDVVILVTTTMLFRMNWNSHPDKASRTVLVVIIGLGMLVLAYSLWVQLGRLAS